MPNAIRPERSELAVPASNWRMVEKAAGLDADVAFLDLEDAVAPAQKEAARANVIRAFQTLDWGRKPRAYRVNGLDTPFFYRDLIDVVEAAGAAVELVILPKAESPADVLIVDRLLRQIEMARHIPRRIGIEVQIESAEGLIQAPPIAKASPRIEALIFGPGDFAASAGVPNTAIGMLDEWDAAYGADRWHFARSSVVVAGRAAGLRVIDGPYADFHDADGFRLACRRSRALGFTGKWCIHPNQIPIANEVFAPSAEELASARALVDAYEGATTGGAGAATFNGQMIDAASLRMAEGVLALARAIRGDSGSVI
jgi:citrate lyase subunit beta/citryl-CoA lyase